MVPVDFFFFFFGCGLINKSDVDVYGCLMRLLRLIGTRWQTIRRWMNLAAFSSFLTFSLVDFCYCPDVCFFFFFLYSFFHTFTLLRSLMILCPFYVFFISSFYGSFSSLFFLFFSILFVSFLCTALTICALC